MYVKDVVLILRSVFSFQLLNLPAQPNIVSILEEFVKSFCVNILFNNSAKTSVHTKEGSSSVPVERKLVPRYCIS